jgi:hypothetical protein
MCNRRRRFGIGPTVNNPHAAASLRDEITSAHAERPAAAF